MGLGSIVVAAIPFVRIYTTFLDYMSLLWPRGTICFFCKCMSWLLPLFGILEISFYNRLSHYMPLQSLNSSPHKNLPKWMGSLNSNNHLWSDSLTMLFPSIIKASLFFSYVHHASALQLTTFTPKPFANPSPNVVSSHILEMTRGNVSTRSSKALQIIRSHYGNVPITALEGVCLMKLDLEGQL